MTFSSYVQIMHEIPGFATFLAYCMGVSQFLPKITADGRYLEAKQCTNKVYLQILTNHNGINTTESEHNIQYLFLTVCIDKGGEL